MSKNQAYFSVIPRGAIFDQRLKPIDRQVIMVLGLYQGFSKEAWPSQVTIAEHIASTQPTISRALKRLEDCGYIVSRKKNKNAPGTAKAYQVRLQNPNAEYVGADISGYSPKECISGHVGADMSHIEETSRRNQKKNNARFDEAWKLYCSTDNKANQVRKTSLAAWEVAVKKADTDTIMAAIKQEISDRENAKGFVAALPNMARWLKEERWVGIAPTKKTLGISKTGQTHNGFAIFKDVKTGALFWFDPDGERQPIKKEAENEGRASGRRDRAVGATQTQW